MNISAQEAKKLHLALRKADAQTIDPDLNREQAEELNLLLDKFRGFLWDLYEPSPEQQEHESFLDDLLSP